MNRRHQHVIVRSYVDTGAFDRHCPVCGAAPAQWCKAPDGRHRRVPCIARIANRPTKDRPDDRS